MRDPYHLLDLASVAATNGRRNVVNIALVNAAGVKCHFRAKTRIFRVFTPKSGFHRVR